jgi:transcriptional regulator with XRE-family HTH domain
MGDFAEKIGELRRKAGLKQAELAKLCDLTPSYVSLLESGKKPPPSDDVVARLARALGEDRAALLELAHLERSPEDVRKKLRRLEGGLRRQRRLHKRMMSDVLPISLYNFTRPEGYLEAAVGSLGLGPGKGGILKKLFRRTKGLRSYRDFQKKSREVLENMSEKELEELFGIIGSMLPGPEGRPASDTCLPVFGEVPVPPAARSDLAPEREEPVGAAEYSPTRYFYRIQGDTMFPRFEPGDLLFADEGLRPRNGNIVLVRVEEEGFAAKYIDLGRQVEFAPANPHIPPRKFAKAELDGPVRVCATGLALRRSLHG